MNKTNNFQISKILNSIQSSRSLENTKIAFFFRLPLQQILWFVFAKAELSIQLQNEIYGKKLALERQVMPGCVFQVCYEQYIHGSFSKHTGSALMLCHCLQTELVWIMFLILSIYATYLSVVHRSILKLLAVSHQSVKTAGILCIASSTLELTRQKRATTTLKTLAWNWD